MAVPVAKHSFDSGEIAPVMLGRQDTPRYGAGGTTVRNFFVHFDGGLSSRPGTAFCGFSKQSGRAYPPKLIPFQFSNNQGLILEFGNLYMRAVYDGAYVTETPINITAISRSDPCTITFTQPGGAASIGAGDWIYCSGIGGMTQLNGLTFIVSAIAGGVASLVDILGNNIDSTLFGVYTSGGTIARIYTQTTIYAETDLYYIKTVQSADVMSICCVNQVTSTEYVPQDLTRISDTNWTFSPVIPAPSVSPPASTSATITSTGSPTTYYEYQVTSIDPVTGTESVASPIASVNGVDMAATAGSVTVSWSNVAGVQQSFVYKALPGYGAAIPVGSLFGYAGRAYGASFVDSNIVPDFTQTPPNSINPFARGQILAVNMTAVGTGYTTYTLTINTSTGSGCILEAVLSSTTMVEIIVVQAGSGYAPTDTITITGSGTGATANLVVGPQTGTYPSVPGYFQERRGYANTLNNPDTYWFSQPGAFTNFNTRNPTIASDAITGSPWAVQVNGIQWIIQTSGGLLVMTGLRAWLLVGAGSFATNVAPISPSTQNDVPQAFSGVSPIIQPIEINYDVIYVEPNGIYYYDLPYQLYALSEPIDLTDISDHLFTGYSVVANCYCEKPYRLIWSVRSDGALLSMTYYKTQKIQGWTRHDTQGAFIDCASIIEPPVNAAYFVTQRLIQQNLLYLIERMNNRTWASVENVWAVDAALSYPRPAQSVNVQMTSATGLGSITGVTNLIGGSGYSPATTATVVDQFGGTGSGATPTLTIVGGVITAITFVSGSHGSGYTQPMLVITDPAGSAGGSGASATPILNNSTVFISSSSVFSSNNVGSYIRYQGGVAVITAYTSAIQVSANVLSPFLTVIIPGSSGLRTIPANGWTMTAPTTVVTGLNHLIGATVTGLADGNVIPPTVVSAQGTITLATPASAIVVGLGFQCQFQDVPIDLGNPTVQGQRKKIAATSVRLAQSRGVKVGTNQPDGASQSPPVLAIPWSNMQTLPDSGPGAPNFPPVPYNALCTPLRTGDVRTITAGGIATPGQLAVQQDNPLPCNLVAIYSEVLPGDTPSTQAPPKQQAKK